MEGMDRPATHHILDDADDFGNFGVDAVDRLGYCDETFFSGANADCRAGTGGQLAKRAIITRYVTKMRKKRYTLPVV